MEIVKAVIITVMIYSTIQSIVFLYQDALTDDSMTWMTAVACGPAMWVLMLILIAIRVIWLSVGNVAKSIKRRR